MDGKWESEKGEVGEWEDSGDQAGDSAVTAADDPVTAGEKQRGAEEAGGEAPVGAKETEGCHYGAVGK